MLSVMSLSIAIGAIDTVAVILRLCARLQNKAILAIDDWLIVISLIPLYTMITSSILCTHADPSLIYAL